MVKIKKGLIPYTEITIGEETPTNERIGNKMVYLKRIDTGAMPNATTKNVATGLTNITLVKSMLGLAYTDSGDAINLPDGNSNQLGAHIRITYVASSNVLAISSGIDRTLYTSGFVDLYYTKN